MFFLVLSFHPSPNLLVLVFLFSCFLAFFLTVLFSHYHFLSSIPSLRFLPLYCLSCFCLLLSLCRLLFFLSLHLASCFPLAGPLSACLFCFNIYYSPTYLVSKMGSLLSWLQTVLEIWLLKVETYFRFSGLTIGKKPKFGPQTSSVRAHTRHQVPK